MKKVLFAMSSLLLAIGAAAQGPPQLSKAKINAPKSTITVNLDGINCSTTAGSNAFAATAWSWGASNPTTIGSASGGAGAGKVSVSSLNVSKNFDQCSPALFFAVASGKHYASATLTQQDSDGNVVLTLAMSQVFVESWQLSGSVNEALPSEAVSFAFEKICVSEPSTSAKVCYNAATAQTQ